MYLVSKTLEKRRGEDEKPSQRPIVMTRKGEPSITVIPLFKLTDAYFLDRLGQTPYLESQFIKTYERAIRISRKALAAGSPNALERYNRRNGIDKIFANWEKDSLLRNCFPLVLNEYSEILIDNTRIVLDATLGLVYRSK